MNIYVMKRRDRYDDSFEIIGVIDSYSSLIWTRRYYTYGDFELVLDPYEENLNLLKPEILLVREKDVSDTGYQNVMIIRNLQITTDLEDGDKLIVSGYCLKSLLARRIVPNQTILSGTVKRCAEDIIRGNIITPDDLKRKMHHFYIDEYNLESPRMKLQVTGKNLEETISDICMTYGYGYDVTIRDGAYRFRLYEGKDRTYDQTENPFVIISPEYGNLINSDYSLDNSGYATTVTVAGEGEGSERKKVTVGADIRGLDRFEQWLDARNTSSNNGEISESDYVDMLSQEGVENLQETKTAASFVGEIDSAINYILGKDYDLGDIVQIENSYGIKARARIIEIIESEDASGAVTIPTFSEMEVQS